MSERVGKTHRAVINRGYCRPHARQVICTDDKRGPGCYGLAHRRPASGCAKCGMPYAARKPVTVEDGFRAAREDRRAMP